MTKTRIYQMAQRKGWHHDDLPAGWKEVAWERFDYVECGIFEKTTSKLTKEDKELVKYYGEPPHDWIEPTPEPPALKKGSVQTTYDNLQSQADAYKRNSTKPDYWVKQGFERNWGDAAVMHDGIEILKKNGKDGEQAKFVILAPELRGPVILSAWRGSDGEIITHGSY